MIYEYKLFNGTTTFLELKLGKQYEVSGDIIRQIAQIIANDQQMYVRLNVQGADKGYYFEPSEA